MNSKQLREIYYATLLQKKLNLTGALRCSEKPDVVLENGSEQIGIEVTDFFLTPGDDNLSEQRQSILREKTVSQAQEIYGVGNNKNVEMSFGFTPIIEDKYLAKKIADFVNTINTQETGSISPCKFGNIPEINYAYILNEEFDDVKWRVAQCYQIKELNQNRLLQIIAKKQFKLLNYTKYAKNWLLICIDFFDFAQDQEIDVKIEPIHSTFDRIFLYKRVVDQLVEVPLLPS